MELNEKQVRILGNLLSTLLRCQIPDITGQEMIAFSEGYHFLYQLKKTVDSQIEEKQKNKLTPEIVQESPHLVESLKSKPSIKTTKRPSKIKSSPKKEK